MNAIQSTSRRRAEGLAGREGGRRTKDVHEALWRTRGTIGQHSESPHGNARGAGQSQVNTVTCCNARDTTVRRCNMSFSPTTQPDNGARAFESAPASSRAPLQKACHNRLHHPSCCWHLQLV